MLRLVKASQSDKPSLWDVMKSVAASFLGVQSAKNRERDFQQTSVLPYIIVGVIFVILLILAIIALVAQLV